MKPIPPSTHLPSVEAGSPAVRWKMLSARHAPSIGGPGSHKLPPFFTWGAPGFSVHCSCDSVSERAAEPCNKGGSQDDVGHVEGLDQLKCLMNRASMYNYYQYALVLIAIINSHCFFFG